MRVGVSLGRLLASARGLSALREGRAEPRGRLWGGIGGRIDPYTAHNERGGSPFFLSDPPSTAPTQAHRVERRKAAQSGDVLRIYT
jgi:hypothetical protein